MASGLTDGREVDSPASQLMEVGKTESRPSATASRGQRSSLQRKSSTCWLPATMWLDTGGRNLQKRRVDRDLRRTDVRHASGLRQVLVFNFYAARAGSSRQSGWNYGDRWTRLGDGIQLGETPDCQARRCSTACGARLAGDPRRDLSDRSLDWLTSLSSESERMASKTSARHAKRDCARPADGHANRRHRD